MIFASDLDQTLIYSPKSFGIPSGNTIPPVTSIEIYEGRQISFMLDDAIEKLKKIASHSIFVPVTTRTIEQYRRISLFQEQIIPNYSVVSNGGNIIVQGTVDLHWHKQVLEGMNQHCLLGEDLLASFAEICHESWAGMIRKADDLFYYCIVQREKVPQGDIDSFTTWAQAQGWNISLQGRKLYLVPQVVNKWAAVAYVRDLLQERCVVTAGDSLLDLCMLEQADYGIVPSHGELWELYGKGRLSSSIKFTKNKGILAAQDILDTVASYQQIEPGPLLRA